MFIPRNRNHLVCIVVLSKKKPPEERGEREGTLVLGWLGRRGGLTQRIGVIKDWLAAGLVPH